MPEIALPARWYPLRPHAGQARFFRSRARFNLIDVSRRAGKSEIAKRRMVIKALKYKASGDGRFCAGAPTTDQARNIWWEDLKALCPPEAIVGINESRMEIRLFNGVMIFVMGLDRAQRLEGPPLDHFAGDEWAEVKPDVWESTVRPALSTLGRPGTADIFGRPKGRNHYWELYQHALTSPAWARHHWVSAEILDPADIAQAREELDPRAFRQEYEAEWLTSGGRAYYAFESELNLAPVEYDPDLPLCFAFDFNVDPGVAVVLQEQYYTGDLAHVIRDEPITAAIGEVHIPHDSNTPRVVRKLLADWGHHAGDVYLYGDPAGGARGTAKVKGSDWDIIFDMMRRHFHEKAAAEHRDEPTVARRIDKRDPGQRPRVNAVNRRCQNANGEARLLIHPRCKHLVRDLEGVSVMEGTDGDLDKSDASLTHLSDALAYYCSRAHKRKV